MAVSVGIVRTGAMAALRPARGNGFAFGATSSADHAGARQQLAELGPATRRARGRPICRHERFELPAAPAALVLEHGHDWGFYQRCPALCRSSDVEKSRVDAKC